MKKLSLMIITMLIGISMAHADFGLVKDKKEADLIRRALKDAVNGKGIDCPGSYHISSSQLQSWLENVNGVYRDLEGQPVILALFTYKQESPKDSGKKVYFYFTTDLEGKKVKNVRFVTEFLEKEEIVNIGTIAQPKYGVGPRKWEVLQDLTCGVYDIKN